MNQIDYQPAQPTSFNPALAQIHNSGGQSFYPRNSAGPQAQAQAQAQAFPQAGYPGPLRQQQQQQQQQQQPQQNGGGFSFPSSGLNNSNVNVNVNGALTNNISAQQQQQQMAATGQQLPYSSAPFSQNVNATPGLTAGGGGGQLGVPHSASQFHGSSPQATFSPPGQPYAHQQSPMTAPQNQMMASPHTPARAQSQPHSPLSPAAHAREKERIEILLEINLELLQEMQALQMQGKGGAATQEHAALMRKQHLDPKMGSEEFVQVMSRVHANLGYLCGASDHALKPGIKQAPHPPNYLHPPPAMPQLAEKYVKLRSLFPGWTGLDGQVGAQAGGLAGSQSRGHNFDTSTSPAAASSMHG